MSGSFAQVQVRERRDARGRTDRVWRGLRRLAWCGAAMTFGVLLLAAAMRFQGAGVGCDPWPACRAAALTVSDSPLWVRATHRVVATLVALCAVGIAVVAFRRARHSRLPRVRAVLAVVGVAGLAVLGRASGAGAPPVVLFGNLIGGLALLAVFVTLAQGWAWRAGSLVTGPVRADFALVVAALLSGALSSTSGALDVCGAAPSCGIETGSGSGVAWMAVLHRGTAVLLLIRLLAGWGRHRTGGRGVLALTGIALGLTGLWQSAERASLAAALLHHALSAILLVAILQVAATDRDRSPG